MLISVRVIAVEFDFDDDDSYDFPSLEEKYKNRVYKIDTQYYQDDEEIGEFLVDSISDESGWCIQSLTWEVVE